MNENQYTLIDGDVYKKLCESKYTYIYCSTPRQLLVSMMVDIQVADILYPFIDKISSFMEEKGCKFIRSMAIDHNFIEVLPYGTCFDISNKSFHVDPDNLKGTPRAYARYTYLPDVIPYPWLFIQGMF